MSYRELIDALNKECEEKVQKIWQEAAAEAERIRTDTLRKLEKIRERFSKNQSSAIKIQTDAILSEAKSKARATRLSAEKELSDRLYRLAVDSLHLLRDDRYKDLFSAFVKELPPYKWGIVKVNPEDRRIVETFFPDSEVIPDNTVIGGLEVTEKSGDISVDNTFEKRLERAWTEMLPEIMRDVYEQCKI